MKLVFKTSIPTDPSSWPPEERQVRVLHDFGQSFSFGNINLAEGRVKRDTYEDGIEYGSVEFGDLHHRLDFLDDSFKWMDSDDFLEAACVELGQVFDPTEWQTVVAV